MAKLVVALGGNALGNSSEEQLKLVQKTAKSLIGLLLQGHKVVISHGNGPQVGTINLELSYASEHNQGPAFPFPECGAMSQGYIGYHLQQSLLNEAKVAGVSKEIVSVVTQVEVDENDNAFKEPTKPIGSFVSKEQAEAITKEKGYTFIEDAGRGYRRVVASPTPRKIVEYKSINNLIEADTLVIASGGGGIPVILDEDGFYKGVPAVIDKDKSSALLAEKLKADKLIILTAVDYICVDFGKETQKELTEVTIEELKKYINEGQFAKGSMLPKVEACISFVENSTDSQALVTSLEHLDEALKGNVGTVIKK